MKKTEIYKNIFHVKISKQSELCLTFLRFQEFYESPKFKGQVFSLKAFKKWYTKQRGRFSYASDWAGFNIPSAALEPFYEGKFNPLTKREKKFLAAFKKHRGQDFYVIGTYQYKSPRVFKHELGHAMFYTSPSYQAEVLKVIRKLDLKPIKRMLRKLGYHKSVFMDECHAYILDGSMSREVKSVDYRKAEIKLNKIFTKYSRKLK